MAGRGREGKDGWTNNHKGYVLEWCLCSLAGVAPRIWPKPRDKYLSRLLFDEGIFEFAHKEKGYFRAGFDEIYRSR